MARSPYRLALLLVLSGCTQPSEREAPRRAPASSAAPPLPSTPPPASPFTVPERRREPLPVEARYARQWLVLLQTSATPGEGGAQLAALARTGLSSSPARLSSSAFRDLRPCLELLVAQALPSRAEAVAFQARLREAGVASDVEYAGPLEAGREAREASCLAADEARAALVKGLERRDTPRFVESYEGRTFLLLGESRESLVLEPLDVRRSVWSRPADADPTGLFQVGDAVDLYGAKGPLRAGCAVKGFVWLSRGVPSVEYALREPPPDAPGCGRVWAFAELGCEVPRSVPVFALPAGAPSPVFFQDGAEAEQARWLAEAGALRRSARFTALRTEGEVQAERVGERLAEEVVQRGFSLGARRVLLTEGRLRVGEGHSVCGLDYDQRATRGAVLGPDGLERVMPLPGVAGEDVEGVMDLEGDGQVELLVRETWPADTLRLVREDGTEVAGAVVEHCDSGC